MLLSYLLHALQVIRQCVLSFLSPLSLPHGIHLLGAVGVAWNDSRKKTTPTGTNKKVGDNLDHYLLQVIK